MDLEITRLEPDRAGREDFEDYFAVFTESSKVDRPDALLPDLAALTEQLRNPHPAMGEQWIWLARAGGRARAAALVNLLPEPNGALAVVKLMTRPRERGRGVGTAVFRHISPALAQAGREVVVGQALTADGPGERWARHMGFHETQRLMMLALELGPEPALAPHDAAVPGYHARAWRGRTPDDLLDTYARARNVIHDAPTGEATIEQTDWTPETVRAEEDELAAGGVDAHVGAVVEEATGEIRALSLIHQLPGQAGVARQLDTAVDPGHRGRGLALWAKATVTDAMRAARPDLVRVLTNIDPSNAAMLAVNRRAGYRPVRSMISVEARLDEVRGAGFGSTGRE